MWGGPSTGQQKEYRIMPIGNQSLVPYTPTVFTAVNGTQYKGQIDADTAISGNVSGSFFVYPNSPAGLSVLVDTSFNNPILAGASGFVANGAGAQITVAVTAPPNNSWYACVFWDLSTNTAGVINGVAAASPNPIKPLNLNQIELAQVLIATGQTSIIASNIFDVRTWLPAPPLIKALGTVGVSQTVNCNGASKILINLAISASVGVTLTNLRAGSDVDIFVSATGTFTFSLAAFSTNAATYTTIQGINNAGAIVNLASTGVALSTAVAAALHSVFHSVGVLQFRL